MSNYDQMRKQAEQMRFKFRDLVDKPDSSEARYLHNEIEGLISDLMRQRDGKAIENRLKNLEHHFKELDQEIMDYQHSNLLKGWCEEMMHHTREL
jgi:hypothetical protein